MEGRAVVNVVRSLYLLGDDIKNLLFRDHCLRVEVADIYVRVTVNLN